MDLGGYSVAVIFLSMNFCNFGYDVLNFVDAVFVDNFFSCDGDIFIDCDD